MSQLPLEIGAYQHRMLRHRALTCPQSRIISRNLHRLGRTPDQMPYEEENFKKARLS